MAKTVHNGCCIIQGEIRYCETDHSYIHIPSGQKLTSVTTVVKRICSDKSWDGVDPATVEHARQRGSAVDKYMEQYVRDRRLTLVREASDVVERVKIAHKVWESLFGGGMAETQKVVFNLSDGIAGRMDFWIENQIVADLKCTYYSEFDWVLQIGAYGEYADAKQGGVIHISPKVYSDGGRWLNYDMEKCREYWRQAVAWWKTTEEIRLFAKK